MNTVAPAQESNDSAEVAALIRTLWRGRWIILACVLGLAAISLGYSLTATRWYRAEVVLAPAGDDGLPPSLGALGGLANLAGINIGANGSDSVEAVAILKSKGFAREFIESRKLLDVLLEGRSSIFASKSKDIRLAIEMFDGWVRRVDEDRKTGLIKLSVQWTDRALAADWANDIVRRINARMRARALAESERNVAYLQKELVATNVVSLQQAVGRLLESEMQKMMMARGNEEFAFKVIDPATEPRRQFWPRPLLLAGLAMLLGGIFSGVYVLLRADRQ